MEKIKALKEGRLEKGYPFAEPIQPFLHLEPLLRFENCGE